MQTGLEAAYLTTVASLLEGLDHMNKTQWINSLWLIRPTPKVMADITRIPMTTN